MKVQEYVRNYYLRHGFLPTMAETGRKCGVTRQTVSKYFRYWETTGAIEWDSWGNYKVLDIDEVK